MIKIVVAGATGRMGQEVVKMILHTAPFSLVAGVSRKIKGEDIGLSPGMEYFETVKEAISQKEVDVLVDFTTPLSVKEHIQVAIENGVRPVVGTTGLTEHDLSELENLSSKKKVGAILAPNFSIGAVLMMIFAAKAAKYLPHVEIIESHHDNKLDAPSGTAWKTADLINENRKAFTQGHPHEMELLNGVRGAKYNGFRIHSIRLPGLLAHQEVLLGGDGEILTLRHDSLNRASFMPGVKLAIERVMHLDHFVYGLENLLDI